MHNRFIRNLYEVKEHSDRRGNYCHYRAILILSVLTQVSVGYIKTLNGLFNKSVHIVPSQCEIII